MILWIILIIIIFVGISYGWDSITQVIEGINKVSQVIQSDEFAQGKDLGIELGKEGLGFLEDRYENYQVNNP